jgi:uncharacterized protein (TIGR03435 family)
MALNQLIETAYRIQRYRIVGPDWLRSQWFEIHATIPEGGTRDKIPEMLQTVLEERLKLKTHFENKEEPVYAIVVQKVGAKVRLTNDASIPTEEGAKNITADGQIKGKREGETTILFDSRTGPVRTTGLSNGLTRTELMKMSLSMFAEWLTPFLDRPAVDATDLKGFYTIPLEFPPEIFRIPIMKMAGSTLPPLNTPFSNPAGQPPTSTGAAPDPSMSVKPLIDAVEKLGLKLDQRKAPYQKLVIDHVERTPVEPE